ncbi:MAG: hypothetical protein HQ546_08930, partial [Planctomycetes bacterium]|nr:hypothetical protein [Planctomycetota bacterium]
GSISLFGGKDSRQHELVAEHIAKSESWVEVVGPGGVVHEWSQLPHRPDNHWFDCLVGCAAAASMVGVKVAGETVQVKPRKRKLTQEDFRRR